MSTTTTASTNVPSVPSVPLTAETSSVIVEKKKTSGWVIFFLIIGIAIAIAALVIGIIAFTNSRSSGSSSSGPAIVNLGSASSFAVLAGSNITNTGTTVINGDLGVSPGSAVSGFPPGVVVGASHINDSTASQAENDLTKAYNDAANRTSPIAVSGDLGGQTFGPGLYRSTSNLLIASGDLTLDAQGNGNAVFIFQVASSLITNGNIILINSANPANVFWQVGSTASIGVNTNFQGSLLANQNISVGNNASVEGRLLTINGQVNLSNNIITRS